MKKPASLRNLLITLFLVLLSVSAYSASSVYFCTESGAYGYAYSAATVEDAQQTAYSYCTKYGGTNCVEVLSTAGKGYGAIAFGESDEGTYVIGAYAGAGTAAEARDGALRYCRQSGGTKNVKIDATWYDE